MALPTASSLLGEAGVGYVPPPPVEAGKYAWVPRMGCPGAAGCSEGGMDVDQVTSSSEGAAGRRKGLRGYQDPMPAQAGRQCPAAPLPQAVGATGPGSQRVPGRGHSSVGDGNAKWRKTWAYGEPFRQRRTDLQQGSATCMPRQAKEAWSALVGRWEPGLVDTATGPSSVVVHRVQVPCPRRTHSPSACTAARQSGRQFKAARGPAGSGFGWAYRRTGSGSCNPGRGSSIQASALAAGLGDGARLPLHVQHWWCSPAVRPLGDHPASDG